MLMHIKSVGFEKIYKKKKKEKKITLVLSLFHCRNEEGYISGWSVELIGHVCKEAGITCHTILDKYENCWDDSVTGQHPVVGPGMIKLDKIYLSTDYFGTRLIIFDNNMNTIGNHFLYQVRGQISCIYD